MVMLVTLQEASDHLRRDTDDDNNDLILKIKGVSRAILNYLKDDMLAYQFEMDEHGDPVLDSSGEIVYLEDSSGDFIPRTEVQQAVLLMLQTVYDQGALKEYLDPSSGTTIQRLGNMSLPRVVHWILDPIREPTIV